MISLDVNARITTIEEVILNVEIECSRLQDSFLVLSCS
jgi:hypothetical protein